MRGGWEGNRERAVKPKSRFMVNHKHFLIITFVFEIPADSNPPVLLKFWRLMIKYLLKIETRHNIGIRNPFVRFCEIKFFLKTLKTFSFKYFFLVNFFFYFLKKNFCRLYYLSYFILWNFQFFKFSLILQFSFMNIYLFILSFTR